MRLYILKVKTQLILFASIAILSIGCSSDAKNNESTTSEKAPAEEAVSESGVGPVKSVDISGAVDEALAEKGKAIFESKCTACHKMDERYVGPALGDVVERRNPAWIMNMIMNPEEMTKKDPEAKKLLAEYMTQMVNQNVNQDDTRAILEYLRTI